MAVELRSPLSRKVEVEGTEIVVIVEKDGIAVRLPGKVKALRLSYKAIAKAAAEELENTRPNRELKKMFGDFI